MMNVFSKSKWIWFSHDAQKADEYAEFFTTFKYEHVECIINISADSDYVVYVNGKLLKAINMAILNGIKFMMRFPLPII